ncbi:MAG TPA: winged helix-turn-helix domain-containing protein [Thiobacillaceae bacterium]|nr:winged helix-turn-helix domain-containing protein [Thiobacillaceae bacterium]HNU64189.1 winged helix-turn-helix domain-containing protein [Thiobacillaceae bacterium]
MRLLIAEDDPQLGDGLTIWLRQDGHAVDWVKDGQAADLALKSGDYDLLLLDLGLPRQEGMAVLRALRGRGQSLPVLILTARDAVHDKIAGLDGGADEYLVKPVSLDELSARVRALLRRAAGHARPCLRLGELVLDPAMRQVTLAGEPIELSAREFALLQVLMRHPGRVMSRAQLEAAVYGWKDEPDSNALEVHIHRLRKKLGVERIRTLRGIGYTMPGE